MSTPHDATRLLTDSDEGHIELITEDPMVMHRARQAYANQEIITFVFSSGEEMEETTAGRVVWIADEPAFRFAVG